jgi:dimethylglycine dehydrogenase
LRVSYVGELGWELHVPMNHMASVYEAIWEAGQAYGLENFGSYALNAMRLEKGFKGASELTTEVTLPEADVMRFAKVDKGPFVGRAATVRSLEQPLPWQCVYLQIDAADADCLGGETVFCGGSRVGAVSSGGFGHWVGKSLAFAYVDPQFAAPGTTLEIMVLGESRPARVLPEPAYDPASHKPRTDVEPTQPLEKSHERSEASCH